MDKTNGVILLVYGIPAAGKTRLSASLCEESQKYDYGTFISVHFDDFYPPDLRTAQKYTSARDVADDGSLFKLKDTRKDINDNVEHLIRTNKLGAAGSDSLTAGRQDGWSKFLHQISSSNTRVVFDDHGRYVSVVGAYNIINDHLSSFYNPPCLLCLFALLWRIKPLGLDGCSCGHVYMMAVKSFALRV